MNRAGGQPAEERQRRLLDAPERYRAWARSTAGLAATACAAIAAGVVFSPVAISPSLGRYAGGAAFLLLLAATGLFGHASIMRMKDRGATSDLEYASRLADKLDSRLTWASALAGLALVALAIMLGAVILSAPQKVDVLIVWKAAQDATSGPCPAAEREIEAQVQREDLAGASQYISATVDGRACGLDASESWILVDRLSAVIIPKGR